MPAVKPVRRKRHREAPAEAYAGGRSTATGDRALRPYPRAIRRGPLSKPTKEISTQPSERLPRGGNGEFSEPRRESSEAGLDADGEL